MQKNKFFHIAQTLFCVSACVILFITGWAKVWESQLGGSKLLLVADPIFGITFRDLLLFAGVSEVLIVFYCILNGFKNLSVFVLSVLSSAFLMYRIGIWWKGWHSPCSCLGSLTEALHIAPQTADNLMKWVLAYFLFVSYGLLFWQKRKKAVC